MNVFSISELNVGSFERIEPMNLHNDLDYECELIESTVWSWEKIEVFDNAYNIINNLNPPGIDVAKEVLATIPEVARDKLPLFLRNNYEMVIGDFVKCGDASDTFVVGNKIWHMARLLVTCKIVFTWRVV